MGDGNQCATSSSFPRSVLLGEKGRKRKRTNEKRKENKKKEEEEEEEEEERWRSIDGDASRRYTLSRAGQGRAVRVEQTLQW